MKKRFGEREFERLCKEFTSTCRTCGMVVKYLDLGKRGEMKYGVLTNTCKTCTRDRDRLKREKNWFRYKARRCTLSASQRNKKTDIDAEYLENLWSEQKGMCALTGKKMNRTLSAHGEDPFKATLDQIEPGKGYLRGNVQFVSSWANASKWNLDLPVFENLILSTAEFIKNKQKDNLHQPLGRYNTENAVVTTKRTS